MIGHPAGKPAARIAPVPTLAALVVVALTVSLGNWQLRRADEKREIQQRAIRAERDPPLAISPTPLDPAAFDTRRVSVRGRFIGDRTVFVDNRTHNGIAGFHVATPVKIEGSELHLLVLRGWVPRDPRDRGRLPSIVTPDEPVTIEGVASASIAQSLELRAAPIPAQTDRIWQNLAFDRFESWSGLRLQPLLVRQFDTPGTTDGLVRDWPEARVDVDKHLGYAFQWFALAIFTTGLWVWFNFLRRRDKSSDAS
ncbi:MAG: hypothetical protein RIS35_1765 [Pseudomonadota bacterium]|jgi:cytochrome oxidase assembly protein ShyY1